MQPNFLRQLPAQPTPANSAQMLHHQQRPLMTTTPMLKRSSKFHTEFALQKRQDAAQIFVFIVGSNGTQNAAPTPASRHEQHVPELSRQDLGKRPAFLHPGILTGFFSTQGDNTRLDFPVVPELLKYSCTATGPRHGRIITRPCIVSTHRSL